MMTAETFDHQRFQSFVGIDYSGAGTPNSKQAGIQVYRSSGNSTPAIVRPRVARGKNWSRITLFEWLDTMIAESESVLIGIDHAFSFPNSYFQRNELKTWSQFLSDFAEHWPTDVEDATVQQFRDQNSRTGDNTEFRIADRWAAGAKSVFQFDVQGSVAKSTHAGLPFLFRLRQKHRRRLHFWPFDGWQPAPGKTVICEIFPTLFRNRYERADRTVDQQDAYAACQWMSDMQKIGRLNDYFHPPLRKPQQKVARLEGWILGVL